MSDDQQAPSSAKHKYGLRTRKRALVQPDRGQTSNDVGESNESRLPSKQGKLRQNVDADSIGNMQQQSRQPQKQLLGQHSDSSNQGRNVAEAGNNNNNNNAGRNVPDANNNNNNINDDRPALASPMITAIPSFLSQEEVADILREIEIAPARADDYTACDEHEHLTRILECPEPGEVELSRQARHLQRHARNGVEYVVAMQQLLHLFSDAYRVTYRFELALRLCQDRAQYPGYRLLLDERLRELKHQFSAAKCFMFWYRLQHQLRVERSPEVRWHLRLLESLCLHRQLAYHSRGIDHRQRCIELRRALITDQAEWAANEDSQHHVNQYRENLQRIQLQITQDRQVLEAEWRQQHSAMESH